MEFNLQVVEKNTEPANRNELLSFRFKDGTSFPASYVDFATQYGYGLTCGQFLIYVWTDTSFCDSFPNQSLAIQSTYSDVLNNADDVWFDLKPDADFEKLKRFIPFARSENGYYLFWDPVRNRPDEMDIYITDFNGLGFVRAASDLYELFEKMTSPDRFKEVFPLFVQEALPATFKPISK